MVSKKRLDYGFNGFRVPVIPKAPRSNRRRGPHKKFPEENQLCAFELLATVAGKLLQESESSACSNVGEKKVPIGIFRVEDDKGLKSDCFDHGSCAESAFVPETSVQERNLLSNLEGLPQVENDPLKSSDFLKKVDCDIKLGISDKEIENGEDGINQMGECVNTNVLINSDSSVHFGVKLRNRDDDENSFGHDKSRATVRSIRPQPRVIGHRRIRKMIASKYWKAAPKLKDYEPYNTSQGLKFYRYRKNIYAQERCQRAPIKKRKLFDHTFPVSFDEEGSSESISNLHEKERWGDKSSPAGIFHNERKDPRVKFSIKSFSVPELYVEIPKTATVGSLKKTVLDAVNAVLGDGIRVGVVLQGKKVKEDNKTLHQAGISQGSNLDTLGFTLEPSFTHVSPSMTSKKRPRLVPCGKDKQLARSPATPNLDSGISNASIDPPLPLVMKLDTDDVDNSEFIIPSPKTPTDVLTDGAVSNSMALVSVPPINMDSLALVTTNPKLKRSELSQRRTRRPFSVTEVEALVDAVENLGTGRWRDVKMRAFENTDHRTYVDLKDKWKTLVHTATISPQQRRGEPVPQELLDRVLSAHGYWKQQHAKHNAKNLMEPMKIGYVCSESVRA